MLDEGGTMPDEYEGMTEQAGCGAGESAEPSSPFITAELVDDWPTHSRAAATTVDFYRPPRLSIAYLLVWTALAAVWMKVMVVFGLSYSINSQQPAWIVFISNALMYSSAVLFTGGIIATIVILCDKARGNRDRLQPGHWLLVIISVTYFFQTLASLVLLAGSFNDVGHSGNSPRIALEIIPGVFGCGAAVAYLVMAIRLRAGRSWRVLALARMVMCAVVGLNYFYIAWLMSDSPSLGHLIYRSLYFLSALIALVTLLVILIAAIVDLARRQRRDGLHWLGLLLTAWGCVNWLTWWIVSIVLS